MFEVIGTEDRFQIEMSATLEGIDRADEQLVAYLRANDVAVDVFGLRILLRESMLNAVTHGRGKDSDKTVRLDLAVDSTGVTLTVEDSGPGFAWSDHSQAFDDLDGDGGRGLALMRIYSDEMSYNEQGNQVVLRKCFKDSVSGGASECHQTTRK